MLQQFGEHIRGWLAGIVIAVIAVAFVAWGLQYYIERNHAEGAVIAVVNGEDIPQSLFQQHYIQAQRQQEQNLGRGLSSAEMMALQQMTLNQMIRNVIIQQAVKKQGFYIGLDQIEQYIEQMPQFQNNGTFDPNRLSAMVENNGYTSTEQFFTFFRDEQLIQQMINGVSGSSFVTPSEVQAVYGLWQQHRDFSFALLPIAKLAAAVPVTVQQIQDYYQSNKNQFMTPAKVQLQYILLSRDALMKNVTVSDADVRSYYDANKNNFMVPASWKIARITTPNQKQMSLILEALKSGKSFSEIMSKPRKEWQTVTQTISAVDVAPALADILSKLKAGQVSKPLPTPGGVTIFEMVENTPAHARSFAEAKSQIKKMLISQQVEQQASQKSEQLSSLVFTNPTSLDAASKQTGLPIQTSPMLTQQAAKGGLFAQQEILNAAFSDSVLKQGNNSNPISLKNGGVIVLRVAKSQPAREKPLADVKATIVAALKKQAALRQVGLQAYTIQTQLQKGQHVASLQWQQRHNASRNEPSTNRQILQAAFSTPSGSYKTVELENGYAIINVKAVHDAKWSSATDQQKRGLMMNLSQMRGANELQIYVRQLDKAAKVTINNKKLANSWS